MEIRYLISESQLFLLESVSRARKQYLDTGKIDKDLFDKFRDTFDGKYLPATIKWYLKNPGDFNFEEVKANIERFENNIKKVDKDWRDINRYKNVEQFEGMVGTLGKSQKEKKDEFKDESVLHEDDNVIIVNPQSHEQTCFWGKDTQWCITETDGFQWKKYTNDDKVEFYFVINKNIEDPRDPLKRVAIAKYRSESSFGDIDYEIYNSQDELVVTEDWEEFAHDYNRPKDESDKSVSYVEDILSKYGNLFKPKPVTLKEKIHQNIDNKDFGEALENLKKLEVGEDFDYREASKKAIELGDYSLAEYVIKNDMSDNPWYVLRQPIIGLLAWKSDPTNKPDIFYELLKYSANNHLDKLEPLIGYRLIKPLVEAKEIETYKLLRNNEEIKNLIHLGAAVNDEYSVHTGSDEHAKKLISNKNIEVSKINVSGNIYNELLRHIIVDKDNNLLDDILEHPKIDVNNVNKSSQFPEAEHPAIYSLKNDNIYAFHEIINHPNFNPEMLENASTTDYLVEHGDTHILNVLIEKGFDINYSDNYLLYSSLRARDADNKQFVADIIDHPNTKIIDESIIKHAIRRVGDSRRSKYVKNDLQVVLVLLKVSGYDLDYDDYSLLMRGIEKNLKLVADLYLNSKFKNEPKVRKAIEIIGHSLIQKYSSSSKVEDSRLIRLIEKYGLNINYDNYYRSAAYLLRQNRFATLDYWLEKDEIQDKDEASYRLLDDAVEKDYKKLIDKLVTDNNINEYYIQQFYSNLKKGRYHNAFQIYQNKIEKDDTVTYYLLSNAIGYGIDLEFVNWFLSASKGHVTRKLIKRILNGLLQGQLTQRTDNEYIYGIFKEYVNKFNYKFDEDDWRFFAHAYKTQNKKLFNDLIQNRKVISIFPERQIEKFNHEINKLS